MCKEMLQRVAASAYNGDEMSLLCAVYTRKLVPPGNLIRDPDNDLNEPQAKAESPAWYRSIWEVLKHVADCKAMYAKQAFGEPPAPFPDVGDTLESLLTYLEATHKYVERCLTEIDEGTLGMPVPTSYHGESAANLFWVLGQHDVAHGAQIQIIRENL